MKLNIIISLASGIHLLSTARGQSPTCAEGFTCFEEVSTDIWWVMGGSTSGTCNNICTDALSGSSGYVCKGDQPTFTDDVTFDHIADGLGFNCKNGGCWGASTSSDMMWVATIGGDERNCYYPNEGFYGCSSSIGNANCFGERYRLVCPCQMEEPPTPAPTKGEPTSAPTCTANSDPFDCNDPYTCWKDEVADIVWVMGGDIFEDCKSSCERALDEYPDFYACKSDQPIHTDANSFEPISTGMGFSCIGNGCDFEPSGGLWIDRTDNCERTCAFPTSDGVYDCNHKVGNANCFSERYTLPCPCNIKLLDEACEWSCPDHSAPVAPWPENEEGTSCLERVNYWRKIACEEGWPECPPAGLPPYVECTSCHECANTQSEYDAIFGSHASFTRCGEMSQGSGGGRTCADVIDAFVSEREDTDGFCQGHCGPIVSPGCNTFHWGRTEEPNGAGFYHFTLNWGNCNTGKCDAHCESVEGTDEACFPSGIDTPGCGPSTSPTLPPTPSSSTSPSSVISSAPTKNPTLPPTSATSSPPTKYPTMMPTSEATIPCYDSMLRVPVNENNFSCELISSNGGCTNIFAQSHCPNLCNACLDFKCVDSMARFILGDQNRKCEDLQSLSPSRLDEVCALPQVHTTCRGTCNICNM